MSNRRKSGDLSFQLGRASLLEIKATQRKLAELEVRKRREEGVGSHIGPKNTVVQQAACWWLYMMHDEKGLSFERIGSLFEPPVTGEAIRLKYHDLVARYGERPQHS